MSEPSSFQVVHETIELHVGFDSFTAQFEALTGRFDPGVGRELAEDPAAAGKRIEGMAGEEGLMLFGSQDHGALFALIGEARKARRYHVGNPLIALQMTRHDIRASLYAPLTVLVHEVGPKVVRVEYDRPSSLFGQFGNPDVTKVALTLDTKLGKLIAKAASLA
jgi:hypothetical protein